MRGRWVLKAIAQKAMSCLPHPQRANRLFQHHVTGTTALSAETVAQRVEWAAAHLDAFDRLGGSRSGMSALELGSGWFPIVPLCFHLAGARSVTMVDLEDLGRDELTSQAVEGLLDAHLHDGLAALGPVDPRRAESLRELGDRVRTDGHVDALASVGVITSPGDVREIPVASPPDLISSNTVFEHIAPQVLEGILARFAEISTSGTVMSHLVDHADHYSYFDESVDVYHFLRYGDLVWRLIDNDLQPMNRLRASDYDELYERAGVPLTEHHRLGCDPDALAGRRLAARFRAMDPADVSCTSSLLVTRFG